MTINVLILYPRYNICQFRLLVSSLSAAVLHGRIFCNVSIKPHPATSLLQLFRLSSQSKHSVILSRHYVLSPLSCSEFDFIISYQSAALIGLASHSLDKICILDMYMRIRLHNACDDFVDIVNLIPPARRFNYSDNVLPYLVSLNSLMGS